MTKTTKTTFTTETTQVREKKLQLTAQEEKVVRMLHGLAAPGDHVLEQVGQEFPETAAKLEELERRAIEAAGAHSCAGASDGSARGGWHLGTRELLPDEAAHALRRPLRQQRRRRALGQGS